MKVFSSERVSGSDNRKSAIENLKWLGLFAIVGRAYGVRGGGQRRSSREKSSASVSSIQALLPVAPSFWTRSGKS